MPAKKSLPIWPLYPKASLIGEWKRCVSFTTNSKSWSITCRAVAVHSMTCALCDGCCSTKEPSERTSPRPALTRPEQLQVHSLGLFSHSFQKDHARHLVIRVSRMPRNFS